MLYRSKQDSRSFWIIRGGFFFSILEEKAHALTLLIIKHAESIFYFGSNAI